MLVGAAGICAVVLVAAIFRHREPIGKIIRGGRALADAM